MLDALNDSFRRAVPAASNVNLVACNAAAMASWIRHIRFHPARAASESLVVKVFTKACHRGYESELLWC